MAFLPEGYTIPKSSDGGKYTKFEQGKNRIRILSSPLMGYEYWTEPTEEKPKGVPIRSLNPFVGIPEDAKLDKLGRFSQKYFWAMKVYNYNTSQVEILQITQKTILNVILEYSNDEDYGDPRTYDITISRKGEKMESEYTTTVSPPKEAIEQVTDADLATPVNLQALLTGSNPFDTVVEEINLED